MHKSPMIMEQLQTTEWSCINKLNMMNNFCIVTVIGQVQLEESIKNRNYTLH